MKKFFFLCIAIFNYSLLCSMDIDDMVSELNEMAEEDDELAADLAKIIPAEEADLDLTLDQQKNIKELYALQQKRKEKIAMIQNRFEQSKAQETKSKRSVTFNEALPKVADYADQRAEVLSTKTDFKSPEAFIYLDDYATDTEGHKRQGPDLGKNMQIHIQELPAIKRLTDWALDQKWNFQDGASLEQFYKELKEKIDPRRQYVGVFYRPIIEDIFALSNLNLSEFKLETLNLDKLSLTHKFMAEYIQKAFQAYADVHSFNVNKEKNRKELFVLKKLAEIQAKEEHESEVARQAIEIVTF